MMHSLLYPVVHYLTILELELYQNLTLRCVSEQKQQARQINSTTINLHYKQFIHKYVKQIITYKISRFFSSLEAVGVITNGAFPVVNFQID